MAGQPKLPPNFRDTVTDTATLMNKLIDRMAEVAGAAGQRWMDGLVKADVTAIAEDLGDKLTAQAEDAWDVAEQDVNPFAKAGDDND